jgi:hypothetical protein
MAFFIIVSILSSTSYKEGSGWLVGRVFAEANFLAMAAVDRKMGILG